MENLAEVAQVANSDHDDLSDNKFATLAVQNLLAKKATNKFKLTESRLQRLQRKKRRLSGLDSHHCPNSHYRSCVVRQKSRRGVRCSS